MNPVAPIAVRIPQAAAMLGIGRSTLYLCIAAGEIDTIKVGRATLVPVESLTAFVASRRRGPEASAPDSP
jgi:excisionase family DNA binding protein